MRWHTEQHATIRLTTCAQPPRRGSTQHEYRLTVHSNTLHWQTTFRMMNAMQRPWPFTNPNSPLWPPRRPNLVANIMENYQTFGGINSPYTHLGFDIRTLDHQEMHSPLHGTVVNVVNYVPGNVLYWSVMVEDTQGFIWQFHHLDHTTITVSMGDPVSQGDILGEVVTWPSSHNGALYHHLHMNIARPHPSWNSIPDPYVDGWRYYNPFNFLHHTTTNTNGGPYSDRILYFHPNEDPLHVYDSTQGSVAVVHGDTDIVVNLHSLFEPTNTLGGHPYDSGLYKISYQVTPAVNCVGCNAVPLTTLAQFDAFPGAWPFNAPNFETWRNDEMLERIYCRKFQYQGQTHQSLFTYNQRQLYYTVTNTHNGQPDAVNGFWDTALSGDGWHTVRIVAQDWYGRTTNIFRRVIVSN